MGQWVGGWVGGYKRRDLPHAFHLLRVRQAAAAHGFEMRH